MSIIETIFEIVLRYYIIQPFFEQVIEELLVFSSI